MTENLEISKDLRDLQDRFDLTSRQLEICVIASRRFKRGSNGDLIIRTGANAGFLAT